jgi:hypothetical protein
MSKGRSKYAAVIFVVAVFTLVLSQLALAATPSVSVSIDTPADGSSVTLAEGETTADVPVTGTASVTPGDGQAKDNTLVYTLDRSSSMRNSAGVDCNGDGSVDPNNDATDARIVCAKKGVAAANAKAADTSSNIAKAGLASFSGDSTQHDVDRGTAGVQKLVAPGFDSDDAGTTPDIVDAANAIQTIPGTDYSQGLTATFGILSDPSNDQPHNLLIFMSDGKNHLGTDVTTMQAAVPAHTLIKTFALGNEVNCTSDPDGKGSLQEVANLSTEGPGSGDTAGVCKVVTDMTKLGDEITTAISATLDSLTWTLDNGAQQTLTNANIDPDLPQTAPATVNYNFTANDLPVGTHKICVQAHGSSGATPLNAEDCTNVEIKAAPAPLDPCTADYGDPGLLTDDTLGQTLWDGGLQLSPLTEDPDRDGIISGPVGTLLEGTPLEVVGDEVACLLDLLIDQEVIPIDL